MNDVSERFEELKAELQQERDELRVRLHLLHAEARDEWDELEDKWQHFESKLERAGGSVKDSASEIGAATEQLGEELANAYRRLKKALQ
jgi:hypothetical protein